MMKIRVKGHIRMKEGKRIKGGTISGSHINEEHTKKFLDYEARMKECAEWLVKHLYPKAHIEWNDEEIDLTEMGLDREAEEEGWADR